MIDSNQQYLQALWSTVNMRPLSLRSQAAAQMMDRLVSFRGGGDPTPRAADDSSPPMGAPQAGNFSKQVRDALARGTHGQA